MNKKTQFKSFLTEGIYKITQSFGNFLHILIINTAILFVYQSCSPSYSMDCLKKSGDYFTPGKCVEIQNKNPQPFMTFGLLTFNFLEMLFCQFFV